MAKEMPKSGFLIRFSSLGKHLNTKFQIISSMGLDFDSFLNQKKGSKYNSLEKLDINES